MNNPKQGRLIHLLLIASSLECSFTSPMLTQCSLFSCCWVQSQIQVRQVRKGLVGRGGGDSAGCALLVIALIDSLARVISNGG